MKWWPNRVFAFLLALTEVNVSLGMVEFCGNDPTSQIEFRKKLADVLINNKYFNEEDGKTPVKRQRNNEHQFIPTACSQRKKIMMDKWSKQRVHIPSTSALPANAAPMAIASALQGSIAAMNVTCFILLVLKTIFHHHAKFHWKMGPKNDPSMITNKSG